MSKKSVTPLKFAFYFFCFNFFLSGCSSNEQPINKEVSPIPVIVTTPAIKNITLYLESIGTLQASVLIEIKPQTNGILEKVMITEGQTVKPGDPLFKIDSKSYEIKVLEAEAQLAMDQASWKAVQKKMTRYKGLAEKDLIAQTEWDELKAQLKKAQATIDLDSARLDFARLELEHCQLNSPLEGRVGKLDAYEGTLVANSQTVALATISKLDPLLVEFTVTEKEFPLLPEDVILISIQPLCAESKDCYVGEVTFLDNHFDTKTGLLLIRGTVQNPDWVLRPGQSVRVQIPISVAEKALVIPQKAIRYNQKGPFVYTVNDDQTVSVKQLSLGKEHGTDQIILEGLNANEQIVLEGHLRLSPGLKVEVKP